MINFDYLAYFILYLFLAFWGFPAMVSNNGDYLEDLKNGFILQFVLIVFSVIMYSIMWAVFRLL